MQIDHNPNEQREGNGIWWINLAIIVTLWAGFLYLGMLDLASAALGVGTGGVLVAWGLEVTGNKVPESWRGNPPRS